MLAELRLATEQAEQRLARARDFFGVPRTAFERKSIRYRLRNLQRAIEAEFAEIEREKEAARAAACVLDSGDP